VARSAIAAGAESYDEIGCRIYPGIMWAKLRMMAEGARMASEHLWGKRAA
jgi:hypothetical protein